MQTNRNRGRSSRLPNGRIRHTQRLQTNSGQRITSLWPSGAGGRKPPRCGKYADNMKANLRSEVEFIFDVVLSRLQAPYPGKMEMGPDGLLR